MTPSLNSHLPLTGTLANHESWPLNTVFTKDTEIDFRDFKLYLLNWMATKLRTLPTTVYNTHTFGIFTQWCSKIYCKQRAAYYHKVLGLKLTTDVHYIYRLEKKRKLIKSLSFPLRCTNSSVLGFNIHVAGFKVIKFGGSRKTDSAWHY